MCILFVHLLSCFSYPFVCMSVCVYIVCPFVCMSVCVYIVCPFVCMSVCMYIVCPFVGLGFRHLLIIYRNCIWHTMS